MAGKSTINNSESSKRVQIRTYLHKTPQTWKDQNKHVQIRAPVSSSVCSEQEQTYTNSHPLVEDTPAKDLLAAQGANSACWVIQKRNGVSES